MNPTTNQPDHNPTNSRRAGFIDASERALIEDDGRVRNIVWIDTDHRTHSICRNSTAPACVKKGIADGQLTFASMVFSDALKSAPPFTRCANVYRASVHEAGHALGFTGDHSAINGSVMHDGDFCDPHAYDILAIKALCQSVPDEG